MNQNHKKLWVHGYLLSQNLIKIIGEDFYDFPSADVALPFVNYVKLGKKILDFLVSSDLMKEGASIDIRTKQFDNDLHGVIDFTKSSNTVTITTSDRINLCKTRFTIIKELCQLYCEFATSDKPFEKGTMVENEISTLVEKQASLLDSESDIEIVASDSGYTEFLAYFMARNLVIPKSRHDIFITLMDYTRDNPDELKYFDVANFIKQPEFEIIALHGAVPMLKEITI